MNWSYFFFILSCLITILCILLFLFIPGFPLFIFFFIPPIFCWSHKIQKSYSYTEPVCPYCGNMLLQPQASYCPHCGHRIREEF
ncbi:MAG: zinc ribbon domain-containing protein [Candidatus Helarchaeota archaeon]